MKFDVHWAPLVSVCTPGWTGAVAAGAHEGALRAGATPATPAKTTSTAARRAAAGRTRSGRITTTYPDGAGRRTAPKPLLSGLIGSVGQCSARSRPPPW